jgi:uncharacterized protein YndB with AHSA1/START domain
MNDSILSKDAVVIERTFDAPINIIWQLWTQPEHFRQWYGPKGFTVPVAQLDVRVGGRHLICMEMQTPDGSMKMWSTGEYTEVVPTERLVYTESMSDEHGNVISNSEAPETTQVTVLLEDVGGRTRMVMTHAGVPNTENGANSGWSQAFEKLVHYLATVNG